MQSFVASLIKPLAFKIGDDGDVECQAFGFVNSHHLHHAGSRGLGDFLRGDIPQKCVNIAAAALVELPSQLEELLGTPTGKVVQFYIESPNPLRGNGLEALLVNIALDIPQHRLSFSRFQRKKLCQRSKPNMACAEAVLGVRRRAKKRQQHHAKRIVSAGVGD